jgi:hypothetical protein
MSLKNVVIGIAIIILTISVAVYGVNTFYASPEYEDFCDESRIAEVIEDAERCEAIGGQWSVYDGPRSVDGAEGYCDRDFTCREEYEDARETYSRNLFLITLPLGILIIALGALIFGLEAVGAGLMGGGVGIILWGVGGFWRFADDWLKFLLSLVGLVILIWLAYYFNKRLEKKKGFSNVFGKKKKEKKRSKL